MRQTLAIADLIPGDMIVSCEKKILPAGAEVTGYPYGSRSLPGTMVHVKTQTGLDMCVYTHRFESLVSVVRED